MGIYKKIDRRLGGWLPGGVKRKGGVTITIPPKATQTTPSGEVITAEKTPSGVKVTSTTGETKRVSVGGRSYNVAYQTAEAQRQAQAQAEAKRVAEAQKIAEAKRQAEIKEKARLAAIALASHKAVQLKVSVELARREQVKIDALRQKLEAQNAQKVVKEYIDKQSRDKVKHETLINRITGERIFTTTNLRTGEVRTRTYEKRRGRVIKTGEISSGERKNTLADIQELKKQLPKGDTLIYNPKTMKITGISSAKLGQTIPYTDKGIAYYNAQMSKVIPTFDFKKRAEEIRKVEAETKQTIKEKIFSRATAEKYLKQWNTDLLNTRLALKRANQNQEINRLANLNIKIRAGQATEIEKDERDKLLKNTARNYELAGEYVGKVIGTTFINIGIGSVDLLNALRKDPKTTLASLPPAILAVIKQDFNRIMSGDPLTIGTVGLEYYTYAKAGQIAGKVFKTSVGIGRYLSPKYFSGIGVKLLIPPITIRKALAQTTLGRKINRGVSVAVKDTATSRQLNKYISELKKGSLAVNQKLTVIQNKAKKIKKIVVIKIKKRKIKTEYNQALKRAKKLRIAAGKKGKTLQLTSPDYKKALGIVDDTSRAIAQTKSMNFVIEYLKRGGKLTEKQIKEFTKAIQKHYKNIMENTSEYQAMLRLSKQDRFLSVKLIKVGKIKSAKIFLNNLIKKIDSFKAVKIMNEFINKIQRGIKISIKITTKPIKIVKKKTISKIKKFKSNMRIAKEKAQAKKLRIKAMKKGRTIRIGDDDYIKAIDFIEDFADNYGKLKAKIIIQKFKKAGGKFGAGQEEKFIIRMQRFVKEKLNGLNEFKNLKNASKINQPFTFKLRKVGKLESAKRLLKRLQNKINRIPLLEKAKRLFRDLKRKISFKKIKKKIEIKKMQRVSRKQYRKTIRYQMEKSRPIRKVTFGQLQKSSDVSRMNKFIDMLFNEMGKRQKINIKSINFQQMKNILKKRMRKAIKTGNKEEIKRFGMSIKNLISDMNKKTSNPDIRIIEKVGKVKRFRTIKDFEVERPKGTYVEVKVGNQVMLQKVEQVAKTKQIQKVRIHSVQKKILDIRPLLKYGIFSISAEAFRTILKSKQAVGRITNQAKLLKFIPSSKQDFKVLQAVSQTTTPALNVATAVAQDVNTKLRTPTKLIPKLREIPKKKKPLRIILPKKFTQRKLSKAVPTFYVVEKVRGKFKKLYPSPLRIGDARDFAVYSIDNKLSRTAFFMPMGMSKTVVQPPKNIQGYHLKNSFKVRKYRIKYKKRKQMVSGFIEKRAYTFDQPGERVTARKLRRKAIIKKAKITPTKRKFPVRRVVKRKISPQQRKVMLRNLAKARAIRMRNLKKN